MRLCPSKFSSHSLTTSTVDVSSSHAEDNLGEALPPWVIWQFVKMFFEANWKSNSFQLLKFAFMSTEIALLVARRYWSADSGVLWVYRALKTAGSRGVTMRDTDNVLGRAPSSRSDSLSPDLPWDAEKVSLDQDVQVKDFADRGISRLMPTKHLGLLVR